MTDLQPAPAPVEFPDVAEIKKLWDKARQELRVNDREYVLNREFDRGNQHITFDADNLEALIRDFTMPDEQWTRTKVNKFRARRRSLTARLTASPLAFEVRATSNDQQGLKRQRLQHNVLRALCTAQEWEGKRGQNVNFTMRGGVAAICWEWDPNATALSPIDPTSQIRTPTGNIRLTALSVPEFGLEPGSRTQEDAGWWMRRTTATPAQAKAIYNLPFDPKPDSMARVSPLGRSLAQRRGESANRSAELCSILAYYRRPTTADPLGAVVHYLLADNEPVAQSPWPYPHQDRLNLYVFSCDDPDETWITDPWLSDARPIQSMYNDVRSTIREHARRAGNARILVEDGSMEDPAAFDDQPGQIMEYARGTEKPGWMQAPDIPRWLASEPDRLDAELNDVLAQPEVARGIAPGDRNSGAALALLAEKADGPLGPFAHDQARGWGVIATNVLRTIRFHMPADAKMQATIYSDRNVPTPVVWTRDDIDPEVEVVVPVEVTEPRSFAAQRAQVIELARTFPQMFQGITATQFSRMVGLSTVQAALLNTDDLAAHIQYENDRMMTGVTIVPDEWHPHGPHIEGHERVRNSAAYEEASPEIQDLYDAHIDAHKAMQARAMMQAMMQQQQMAALMPAPTPQGPAALPPGDEEGLEPDEPDDE